MHEGAIWILKHLKPSRSQRIARYLLSKLDLSSIKCSKYLMNLDIRIGHPFPWWSRDFSFRSFFSRFSTSFCLLWRHQRISHAPGPFLTFLSTIETTTFFNTSFCKLALKSYVSYSTGTSVKDKVNLLVIKSKVCRSF